jgi:hypothetical protein
MGTLMVLVLALVGSPAATLAQDVGSQVTSYCADLKKIAALAMTKERFASITGKPRDGNFLDTSLPLRGWKDCSLYGPGTYTCDSQELRTAQEADKAQARNLHLIKACLGEAWTEAPDRSSPSYVVLHAAEGPVSITLSTDETDQKEYLVRLIVFVRRN